MGKTKNKQLPERRRGRRRGEEELAAEMERLKLGPTALWTGLVLYHKDVFVSHVLSNYRTDFVSFQERESRGVAHAGVNDQFV